jgi:hypothetical protein
MAHRRLIRLIAVCALALVATAGLAACGKEKEPGEEVREGLATAVDGLHYTVFITRQFNLADAQDRGYLPEQEDPGEGLELYGVFLEACNKSDEVHEAVDVSNFRITDTQDNEYEPLELEETNPFAFKGGPVQPKNCEPARGSLAQQGPASGSILLFELPIEATENRPLKLHIESAGAPGEGHDFEAEEAVVILDV